MRNLLAWRRSTSRLCQSVHSNASQNTRKIRRTWIGYAISFGGIATDEHAVSLLMQSLTRRRKPLRKSRTSLVISNGVSKRSRQAVFKLMYLPRSNRRRRMTKRSLLDTYLSSRQSSFHWTAMVGTFSVLSIITTIVLVLCALQAQLNKSQEKELEAIVLMQNASRRIAFCRA